MPVSRDTTRQQMDKLALDVAIEEAEKGLAEGGIPIGAALIDPDGNIVARGHNRRVQTDDPTSHGETDCIRNAGRRRDWHTLTMATTLSPCAMCTGTAILHRIPRLVIGENKTFQGPEDYVRSRGIELEIVNSQACIDLMTQFIEANPALWNEDIGE